MAECQSITDSFLQCSFFSYFTCAPSTLRVISTIESPVEPAPRSRHFLPFPCFVSSYAREQAAWLLLSQCIQSAIFRRHLGPYFCQANAGINVVMTKEIVRSGYFQKPVTSTRCMGSSTSANLLACIKLELNTVLILITVTSLSFFLSC